MRFVKLTAKKLRIFLGQARVNFEKRLEKLSKFLITFVSVFTLIAVAVLLPCSIYFLIVGNLLNAFMYAIIALILAVVNTF